MFSLGLFRLFGRSRELQNLDRAFREAGLHPRLVPEPVKITTMKLLKETHGSRLSPYVYTDAAELLGYCMLGANGFAESNGTEVTEHAERRIAAASRAGDTLDARLVLLALHAGVIQAHVVQRFGLEADPSEFG